MIDCYWQSRPVRMVYRPCFVANVSGDDWDRCDKFKQWNDRPRDAYTKGIISNPIRIGKLAEVACGAMLNQEPDFAFRHGGDNQDFSVGGLSIDVKATATSFTHCCLMVVSTVGAVSKWKDKDIFILCRVNEYPTEPRMASVQVTGWLGVNDVAQLTNVPSAHAAHTNKELRFVDSRTLPELINILRERGASVLGMEDVRWVGEKYGFEKLTA